MNTISNLTRSTLIIFLLCQASALHAAEGDGWYARILAGATTLSDSDTSIDGAAAVGTGFSTGQVSGGAIGRATGNWRFEADLMYRSNDVDRLGLDSSVDGDFASLGLGFNALYEFNLFGSEKARSYVGGGLVYIEEIDFDLGPDSQEISYSDSDVGIQLIAGARYEVSDRWDLFAELRYFDAGSVNLTREGGSEQLRSDYANTSLMFGVGYRF